MTELRQKYEAVMRAIDDLLNVRCGKEDKLDAVGEIIDTLEPKATELRDEMHAQLHDEISKRKS